MKILYIDSVIPAPKFDSGSIDAYNYMNCLVEMGHKVNFLSYVYRENFFSHAKDLMDVGIEVLSPTFGRPDLIDDWVFNNGSNYDIIILSRPEVGSRLLQNGRGWCQNALLIYSTVDLHHIRLGRKANLSGSPDDIQAAKEMLSVESAIFQIVDKVVVVSESESSYLESAGFGSKVMVWPLLRKVTGRLKSYDDRRDVVFIGSFSHAPNSDGLHWFLESVWPLIIQQDQTIRLHIVGSSMPDWIRDLDSERIVTHGFVENLDEVFDNIRLSIAPLRYGAGLKGKIVTSLSYGVPVVSTSIGAEGMPNGSSSNNGIVFADSPELFAESLVKVYQTDSTWSELSLNGLGMIIKNFWYYKIRDEIRSDLFRERISPEISEALRKNVRALGQEYLLDKISKKINGNIDGNSKPFVDRLINLSQEFSRRLNIGETDFLHYANKIEGAWYYDVAIAQYALESKEWDVALYYAERSLSKQHTDLYSQEVWMKARDGKFSSNRLDTYNEYLRGRYCSRPESWLEITKGASWVCCSSWLPVPIGVGKSLSDDLQSNIRKKIQSSIYDGSFRYCSKLFCPAISAMDLPERTDECAKENDRVKVVNLCYDESCNLACPTCRSEIICASKSEQLTLEEYYRDQIQSIIESASVVNVTGSGDPFYSSHFRSVIKEISHDGKIEIDLQTNGVLADERAFSDLGVTSVRRVWISLDAANEYVYKIIRVNGDYLRVIRNIAFLVKGRRAGRVEFVGLDFVVQGANLHHMKLFVYLAKALGVDKVRFNLIRNWGTFEAFEFNSICPGFYFSPLRRQFDEIMKDPIFLDNIVDLGNLPIFMHNQNALHGGGLVRDMLHT